MMTDDKIALRELLEKGSDASFLREMIGFAAERLMELEVGEVTGAAHGERSPDRLVQRNGYRERDWQTWAGTVELRIRRWTVTDAAQHDSRSFAALLDPENTASRVWADTAHRIKRNLEVLERCGLSERIQFRWPPRRELSEQQAKANASRARIRSGIEHTLCRAEAPHGAVRAHHRPGPGAGEDRHRQSGLHLHPLGVAQHPICSRIARQPHKDRRQRHQAHHPAPSAGSRHDRTRPSRSQWPCSGGHFEVSSCGQSLARSSAGRAASRRLRGRI